MKRPHRANSPEEYNRRWLARVMANTVTTESGCVIWQGFHQWNGYGHTGYRGRSGPVHRFVYQVVKGVKLGRYDFVCHTCDVRDCLAIAHLWVGGPHENNMDAALKGRHYEATRTHCPKGHPYDEANTYITVEGKRNCRACSLVRQRLRAGWPEDLAHALPSQPKGTRPVNARWVDLRRAAD